ncbi:MULTISPECIES: carbon storage regulator [Legionellaceae]|uniref:Pleiotropic regulatory protein for carbon source metabolism (Modular protein) n=1 Tax=Legionella bozemanae TaxID=447 RepID=A0A0W0R9F8_LEGBO|nr:MULTISPECIES: carbon storage regulator [Legionellaceae]KTC67696.1 pleiotropic regulatory protein for carbon source metabolism (modular protein) [Legionella bozemanae]MCW8497085.1 carbon storage regulator [Fluoribacter dumoffii]STO32885.1 Carbon storage regulator [Legionella bozemanae]
MVVLSRKIGEKVLVDDGEIEVKVLCSKGNKILLGFKVPANMGVEREEDYLRKILQVPEFLKVNQA